MPLALFLRIESIPAGVIPHLAYLFLTLASQGLPTLSFRSRSTKLHGHPGGIKPAPYCSQDQCQELEQPIADGVGAPRHRPSVRLEPHR
jgi:hypothetical protein